jgi:hypothetical protein
MTWKGFLISLGVAIAFALVGIVLLGLPGALAFALGSPFAELIYGSGVTGRIHPDAMWPIAIYMTLLWPISIPAGYALSWGLFKSRKRLAKWLILIGFTLLWATALTLLFVRLAPKE